MCLSCRSLIKSSGSLATSTCECVRGCESVCVRERRGVVNVIENHCPYVDKDKQRGLVGVLWGQLCLQSCFPWRKRKQGKLLLWQEPVSMLHCKEKKRKRQQKKIEKGNKRPEQNAACVPKKELQFWLSCLRCGNTKKIKQKNKQHLACKGGDGERGGFPPSVWGVW